MARRREIVHGEAAKCGRLPRGAGGACRLRNRDARTRPRRRADGRRLQVSRPEERSLKHLIKAPSDRPARTSSSARTRSRNSSRGLHAGDPRRARCCRSSPTRRRGARRSAALSRLDALMHRDGARASAAAIVLSAPRGALDVPADLAEREVRRGGAALRSSAVHSAPLGDRHVVALRARRYRAGADGRSSGTDPRSSPSTARSSRRCGPAAKSTVNIEVGKPIAFSVMPE